MSARPAAIEPLVDQFSNDPIRHALDDALFAGALPDEVDGLSAEDAARIVEFVAATAAVRPAGRPAIRLESLEGQPGRRRMALAIVNDGQLRFSSTVDWDVAANFPREAVHVVTDSNELAIAGPSSFGGRSNDSYITSKVKARMVDSKKFSANHVKTVTENGVVYLMGLVKHQEALDAVEVARTTSGVKKVVTGYFEYID